MVPIKYFKQFPGGTRVPPEFLLVSLERQVSFVVGVCFARTPRGGRGGGSSRPTCLLFDSRAQCTPQRAVVFHFWKASPSISIRSTPLDEWTSLGINSSTRSYAINNSRVFVPRLRRQDLLILWHPSHEAPVSSSLSLFLSVFFAFLFWSTRRGHES